MTSQTKTLAEASRGFLLITGAKIWFLLTAMVTTLAFPRLFGNPVIYGQYRVISAVLNVITMVVITATVQSVAKLASEHQANIPHIRSMALRTQAIIFVPLVALLLLFANPIATYWLSDPSLGLPLQITSVVVLAYSGYAVLVGLLNGTRNFGRQAALDITFATMKTLFMVLAVLLTASVAWTYFGFSLAAVLILLISIPVSQKAISSSVDTATGPTVRRYMGFLLPLAAYAFVLNLLLQSDVILLKAIIVPAEEGSRIAGLFGAAKNLALLPYQAIIALSFVIFPLVSRVSSQQDHQEARRIVYGSMRLAAILSCAALVCFAATPDAWLGLLYGAEYVQVSSSLLWLMAGIGMLSLMHIGSAILASAGRPLRALLGSFIGLLVQVALLWYWIKNNIDTASTHAAYATAIGCTTGAIFTLALVIQAFKSASWLSRVLLTLMSAAATLLIVWQLPPSLFWIFKVAAALLIYGIFLLLVRVIGLDDWNLLLGLIRRKKA